MTAWLKLESKNILSHMCDTCTYHCGYLPHTTLSFYIIDFQINTKKKIKNKTKQNKTKSDL